MHRPPDPTTPWSLENRRALVDGATRGVGKAPDELLVRRRMRDTICARTPLGRIGDQEGSVRRIAFLPMPGPSHVGRRSASVDGGSFAQGFSVRGLT